MSNPTAEMIERGSPQTDRRRGVQRRRMASRVQKARERLTSSGTGHRNFDRELLRLFAQGHQQSLWGELAVSLLIAAISLYYAPHIIVAAWLGICAALTLSVSLLARRFLRLQPKHVKMRGWQRTFGLATGAQSLAWSLGPLIFLALHVQSPATVVSIMVVLQLAMVALLAAAVPAATYMGLVPLTTSLLIYLFIREPQVFYPLAVLVLACLAYFMVFARQIYVKALEGMKLEADKDELIAELEQSKLNSDEARRRAEEASLAKSRFLATMSHELRTPLNAILGFSEVMKGELFGPHQVSAYKDYSGDIHASGQHLLGLINEILDLSRVEAGRQELREEPVSLIHVVEECRHLMKIRAQKREIIVTENIESTLPRIWADERAVRQITLNLLSNAIKFTPQGGAITIKVGWTQTGGQYLMIRDNGPGIPESEIPVVMSSFGRGSLAQKNADEGSGLGLPIVKGLMELHGGTLALKSKIRVGTDAIVVFPPSRVMAALPQLDPDAPVPSVVQLATKTAA